MKRQGSMKFVRTGFTLIELLVVIAVIALLISMLLPALGKARLVAQSIVCRSMQRSLGQAQLMYSLSNKDYYAAYMTSGADAMYNDGANVVFETSSGTPTSSMDWISPSIGESAALSPNRARRTLEIFNKFGCAAQKKLNDTVYAPSNTPGDMLQFNNVQRELPFKAISFLQPSNFAYPSSRASAAVKTYAPANSGLPTKSFVTNFANPCTVPAEFVPRLDRVGIQLSNKILCADGTRYWTEQGGARILDFDPDADPSYYGSFTDPGPIFDDSAAYSRAATRSATQANAKLSMRHQGDMNACFFDGSARVVKQLEAYTRVDYWYPSGSVFTAQSCTTESRAAFEANKPIP
jgi:hypothetical protein